MLTAYNVKTKMKGCIIKDAVIKKTARGGYIAHGHDGEGNKLTALLTEAKAMQSIENGHATRGF